MAAQTHTCQRGREVKAVTGERLVADQTQRDRQPCLVLDRDPPAGKSDTLGRARDRATGVPGRSREVGG